jgi:uncharacterized protein (TIGR02757 family)
MVISPEVHALLDAKASFYNRKEFINSDPISIPHLFTRKEDIEIAGFLTATISWGQRKTIINKAKRLMQMMELKPHDFILNSTQKDWYRFNTFTHRTFNGLDCQYFIQSLQNIYKHHGGLENVFSHDENLDTYHSILRFREVFFETEYLPRTGKHVADPSRGASAKRINMFLRWMVRKDDRGVDFGIWNSIKPQDLCCPLDVHSGRVARKLGLLERKQNDWKTVIELTEALHELDPSDPVKYDFALFGMGVFEKF